MSAPTKEGWMTKQGGMIKTWKKRWFMLVGQELIYSEKPGKKESGKIDLSTASDIADAPECKKPHAFRIVVDGVRTYYICAQSEKDEQEWINFLKAARGSGPAQTTTSAPAAPERKIGVNDFDTIRVIGRGSYGKVQLVRCKVDGKLYAMKEMSKQLLEESEQIEQTLVEKRVLLQTVHPFLVGAHYTFQTTGTIFMVLDYVPGGELFGRLKEEGSFSEQRVRLYAAEILIGLGHLHSLKYVYRDLKPENILVDSDGHLKLTDFGLVKPKMDADSTTSTFCGTPEYIAPEMLQQQPYTKAVDWWSFGILVYEMLTGLPPFYDENVNKMYRMILSEPLTFPDSMSPEAQDLITQLLDRNPETRLGSSANDYEDIKKHPFFAPLDWDQVYKKQYTPEWKPTIKGETDTSNFDEEFTQEQTGHSFEDASMITAQTQQEFVNFTCTSESAIEGLG